MMNKMKGNISSTSVLVLILLLLNHPFLGVSSVGASLTDEDTVSSKLYEFPTKEWIIEFQDDNYTEWEFHREGGMEGSPLHWVFSWARETHIEGQKVKPKGHESSPITVFAEVMAVSSIPNTVNLSKREGNFTVHLSEWKEGVGIKIGRGTTS